MNQKNKNQEQGERLDIIRHSTSHIMAAAIRRIFPEAKFAIGPTIENGFYYDFDLDKESISESDLKKIENLMEEIIRQKSDFKKSSLNIKEALELMKNQPYKQELIEELGKNGETEVSFYQVGDFADLCRGPHVDSTKELGHFKLLSVAGAYWRGNVKNKMLTRIYGTAFASQKELGEYLKLKAEAEAGNHIKIGKELDLYTINEVVGKGLPLLTPKGATIKRILRRFTEDEEIKRGYEFTDTPIMARSELYKISGHLDHYRESMFVFKTEEDEMVLRPMTCPHQFMVYKRKAWSYRELPVRYAETATLFRNELSGELHGLVRIRQFTLADAHIICRPDQLEQEFEGVLNLIKYLLDCLNIKNYWYRFSKWDPQNKEKYIDNPKAWEDSQTALKKILDKNKIEYVEAENEAAFYGPKLDVQLKNVFGKEDTFFTIQIDFALPERFDMYYIDQSGRKVRPMVIHRASIGCYERTMALLIEQYAGEFPLWLAPVQVKILPISEKFNAYAQKVADELRGQEIRAEIDLADDTLGKKIRNTEHEKIPYMLILGDKEQTAKKVAVRKRKEGDLGQMELKSLVERLKKEITEKK